jgi:hypothetical protein
MATLTLKSIKDMGAGNFEYTFECFCSPRPLKTIVVTSGNDNEARVLAGQECDEYCISGKSIHSNSSTTELEK